MLFEGGKIYTLAFWLVDNQPQTPRQGDVQLTMNSDRTVVAVYNLLGDVNGDCSVNILDMLFVRNRLGRSACLNVTYLISIHYIAESDLSFMGGCEKCGLDLLAGAG